VEKGNSGWEKAFMHWDVSKTEIKTWYLLMDSCIHVKDSLISQRFKLSCYAHVNRNDTLSSSGDNMAGRGG
jgi:hypothetical protein